MKKKQFISWFALLMGVFLLFFAGGSQVKADTASDVDSAIDYGTNIIRQNKSIGAWGGVCLSVSDGGITDAQTQNVYNTIVSSNGFISGKNVNGTSDDAATIGLAVLGKDPTHVTGDTDVVAQIRDDATTTNHLNTMLNHLWALSTGNYGSENEAERAALTKQIVAAQQENGFWNEYGTIYTTGITLMVLSMNTDQPGVSASIQKAVSKVIANLYLPDGGFGNSDQSYEDDDSSDNAIMTGGLAATGVDVYLPLNQSSEKSVKYTSPVQRLLDQKVEATDPQNLTFEQAIYNLEQARFTHDGGKGSIFAFDQNPTFKPRELAKLNSAAAAKKVAINGDSTATASDKATAINTVDRLLQAYITKINADTVSTDAIVDRATGVANINNVVLAHTATPTTPTTPSVTNNYTTIVNSPTNSSSSSTNPSTTSSSSAPVATTAPTPTVTKKPAKKAKQSVVYALTTVKLYRNTNFTKSNLKKTYNKRPRINRPMFLVISQRTNKQGHAIYRVKDMNSGKTGYTLSGSKYFAHAYYSAKVTRIKVINPKGINEYGKVNLTSKKRHVKKNASLNVKKVVNYGRSNRMQLTNGRYITANKKLILATKIKKSSQNTRPSTPAATTTGTTTSNPSTNSGSMTTTTTTNTNSKPTTTGTTTTNNSSSATPTLPVTPTNPVTPSNDAKTITTTISIHADGATIASGSIKVNSGASAFDALQAFAQQQGLALTYKGSGATAYVTGISGYSAGPAGTMTGWLYSINGTEPGSSMGAYILKDGDSISMTYNK